MEEIVYLKNRIRLIEKLFDNRCFKDYQCFEKDLLHTPEYKEYFLVKHGISTVLDSLEKNFDNALSAVYPKEDFYLYAGICSTAASIRFQYEEDKKHLEELENGNHR